MSLSFSDAAKAKQLRDYFNRHGRIYIVVDATQGDVSVPDHLRGDPALRLVLNVRMPQMIHIGDDRLDSDFSFSGQVFCCQIPMHTIWAAYLPEGDLEQGIIWDDSVPEMIKTVVQAVRSNVADEASQSETSQAKAPLDSEHNEQTNPPARNASTHASITVINGGGSKSKSDKAGKANHLRVVK